MTTRKGYLGYQQPAPVPSAQSTTVRDLAYRMFSYTLKQQDRRRKERYGTGLYSHNGRSAIVDAMQETADLFHYLTQAYREQVDPEGKLTDEELLMIYTEGAGDHPSMETLAVYAQELMREQTPPQDSGVDTKSVLARDVSTMNITIGILLVMFFCFGVVFIFFQFLRTLPLP